MGPTGNRDLKVDGIATEDPERARVRRRETWLDTTASDKDVRARVEFRGYVDKRRAMS